MPSMKDAFPSKYLAAEDLQGRDHVVTIDRYTTETMKNRDGGEDLKYVFFLRGAKKGWVMNKTNAKAITSMHGTDFDGWIGKQVTIGATWVESFGDTVLAIRVRPGLAPAAQAAFAPPNATPANGPAPAGPGAPETPLGEPVFTDENVAKSELDDEIPEFG